MLGLEPCVYSFWLNAPPAEPITKPIYVAYQVIIQVTKLYTKSTKDVIQRTMIGAI